MTGDIARYQIDYILVKNHFTNQVKFCKAYPSANGNSDHSNYCYETRHVSCYLPYAGSAKDELFVSCSLSIGQYRKDVRALITAVW